MSENVCKKHYKVNSKQDYVYKNEGGGIVAACEKNWNGCCHFNIIGEGLIKTKEWVHEEESEIFFKYTYNIYVSMYILWWVEWMATLMIHIQHS